MISAVVWLPKGTAKIKPELAQPSEEELAALRARAAASASGLDEPGEGEQEEEEEEEDGEGEESEEEEGAGAGDARPSGGRRALGAGISVDASVEAALAELHMETYDDEEADEDVRTARLFGASGPPTFYASNEEDPYITLQADDEDDEDDGSEFTLRDTDLVLLAARTEDDVSHLEVCVYEEAADDGEANLFVHHDLMLPAFPLALAWLDCPPGAAGADARGNFVAVGTMLPTIELWDLDVLDAVEPVLVLGRAAAVVEGEAAGGGARKKKGKGGAGEVPSDSHTGAVMGLAWNVEFRNVLASASADSTVKVWDVVQGRCEHTLGHHSGKVQAVAWNAAMASVLLSGSFDQTVAAADVRAPGAAVLSWQLGSDVESLAWNPAAAEQFLASSEDGLVRCFDARRGGGAAPLFTLAAHSKPACTLALSACAPGLLATGSTDKQTKVWDISAGKPELLAARDLRVGAVFSAAFARDAPHLLAAAGAKGTVTVWDVTCDDAVARRFGKQLGRRQPADEV